MSRLVAAPAWYWLSEILVILLVCCDLGLQGLDGFAQGFHFQPCGSHIGFHGFCRGFQGDSRLVDVVVRGAQIDLALASGENGTCTETIASHESLMR